MTKKKTDGKSTQSSSGIARFRWFLMYFIPFISYSIGFLPTILIHSFAFGYIPFVTWLRVLIIPFYITLLLGITLLSELLITGIILKGLGFQYKEGTYNYNIHDKMTFKWMMVCSMYTPFRKISEIIILGPFKTIYLRLLGMKIGNNTLVGGTIKDPCLTELGDNVTIGEYAVLYAHIQDLEKESITMRPIRVGNNCVIGAGAIIMPGVKMEDNVIVAAGSVVPKNQVLKKGKIYAGNPVKEITKSKND